jgi:uncharacterized protein involved in exopolysaccharide biosynthesis
MSASAIQETENKKTKMSYGTSLVKIVVSKWWVFLIVGALTGALGAGYAYLQQIQYKSKLTFALDDDGSGLSGIASLASQFGLSIGGGDKSIFSGDNIIEIMRSRRIIERVLLTTEKFDNHEYTLIERYLDASQKRKQKKVFAITHFPVGQDRSKFTYLQDSVLKLVYQEWTAENLQSYRPDRKLNIYEVSVTTPDEKLSKVFTDRIVEQTINFYTEIRTKKANSILGVLENRVASMKGNLHTSIDDRAFVKDANLNPAFAQTELPMVKQQANIQVYSAAYTEMFKNLEIARFQYLNQIPLLQIIDPADYPMERIKMSRLRTGLLFSILSCLLLLAYLWAKSITSRKKELN